MRAARVLSFAFPLWVFSFLDAYYTATEINQGIELQVEAQNPRVAVVLNLLTAGLGYFYLGERTKGMVLFIGLNLLKFVLAATAGYWQALVQILSLTVAGVMAVDAYRIAKRQIGAELGPQPEENPAYKPSRLPSYVPAGLATLATAGFLAMLVFGMAIVAIRGPVRSSAVPGSGFYAGHKMAAHGQTSLDRAVGDLLTTVPDIQKVERNPYGGQDETAALQRDIGVLNTVLGNGSLNSADIPVVYYYRGQALRLMNGVREPDGEQIDLPTAQGALADYDKVIAGDSNGDLREVTVANAQYWAGFVARDYLHSHAKAYSYWEKCAELSHAGCLHLMASARLTGRGGQKVDIKGRAAIKFLGFQRVGIRGECAAPWSAQSIAKIVRFTGIRLPGDDELAWINRSYGLTGQLESITTDANVCNRADAEIEEFLYRLESGQRKNSILKDAENRISENSTVTQAVIRLLSRASDEKAFQGSVDASKSKDGRCSAYFYALWYSEITGKHSAEEEYYRRLTQIGSSSCSTELVYARKFKL
jgi:hypothetical protein